MRNQISSSAGFRIFVSSLLLSALFCGVAQAQVAPPLGTTSTYAITASTYTNSNTPPATIVTGSAGQPAVCYTTPPTTPPIVIVGTTIVPCPPAVGSDQGIALVTLNSQACVSLGAGAVTLNSVLIVVGLKLFASVVFVGGGGATNGAQVGTVTMEASLRTVPPKPRSLPSTFAKCPMEMPAASRIFPTNVATGEGAAFAPSVTAAPGAQ